ncbi:MAG: DUF4347 domain-containing protein, partial [Pseudomonadota bacterium]
MPFNQRLKTLAKRGGAGAPAPVPRSAVVESLEPRTMFSADVLSAPPEPADDPLDEHLNDVLPDTHTSTDNPAAAELVFIDQRVAEVDLLISELRKQQDNGRPLEIQLVPQSANGIDLISSVLSSTTVSAVHIISHGSTSGFHLGDSWVDAQFTADNSATLESWRDGLTGDADIMLYGCNLAETAEGRDLSVLLAGLTGADVATSIDTTGHLSFGGDWILEHQTGAIETTTIGTNSLATAWEHELLSGTNSIDMLYG